MAERSLNKVQIIGRLGKDPELRYTSNGKACATLSVATNSRYKDGEEWKDQTEWHRVVLWEKQAENAGEYLKKGSQVYIEGRLQTRSYDDKEGVKRYTTEIVGWDMIFFGGKGNEQRPPHPADEMPKPPQENGAVEPPKDDIPF